MTDSPRRLQRSRAKGARLPPDTVCVTRPGRWGNRFRIEHDQLGWWCMLDRERGLVFATEAAARHQAVVLYCEDLTPETIAAARTALRGRNLACFCAPSPAGVPDREWCHAGALLALAND